MTDAKKWVGWSDMQSYGHVFTKEAISWAWDQWDASRGYQNLERHLVSQDGRTAASLDGRVTMRVADRMMQKARKAGLARFHDGKWEKIAVAQEVHTDE